MPMSSVWGQRPQPMPAQHPVTSRERAPGRLSGGVWSSPWTRPGGSTLRQDRTRWWRAAMLVAFNDKSSRRFVSMSDNAFGTANVPGDQVVDALQRAVTDEPHSVPLRLHLAELLLDRGDAARALGEVAAAVAVEPDNT